ncbi:MAG: type I methionyl aminopeptidase [Candidatus Kerfeldbacteria bacterium]|nr:type I methionyl aminopeptidase [Candidatus Kerfeldbacteria bacterium]
MITRLSADEQVALRASGAILGRVMNELVALVRPGIRLLDLEIAADRLITEAGAVSAFKGYKGYVNVLCTSVNEEVVHCPPSARLLQDGDIISIDNGVVYQGMYSDCAVTVPVGTISTAAQRLLQVTRDALYVEAIKMLKPGNTIGDIGQAVQRFVERAGLSVVRSLVGHGIGHHLHEEPSIPNYGTAGRGAKLVPGMAIAIEPMVNIGGAEVEFMDDGWRVVTADGSLSAHFEHTFLITNDGYELITKL